MSPNPPGSQSPRAASAERGWQLGHPHRKQPDRLALHPGTIVDPPANPAYRVARMDSYPPRISTGDRVGMGPRLRTKTLREQMAGERGVKPVLRVAGSIEPSATRASTTSPRAGHDIDIDAVDEGSPERVIARQQAGHPPQNGQDHRAMMLDARAAGIQGATGDERGERSGVAQPR